MKKILIILSALIVTVTVAGRLIWITHDAPFCKGICIWTRYLDEYGGYEPHKLFN